MRARRRPSTGRVELSGFEVDGLAKIGRDVWVATPGGGISVVPLGSVMR